jgi:alpha-methylacyl-CoA racemase
MSDTSAGSTTAPTRHVAADGRPAGALRGVRVLDFTTLLPGPLATLLLAEAGATVLKIEPPGGDPIRHQGPLAGNGESLLFQLLNRGKHLQTLDLKSAQGREAALELARGADVLVEQFRPGVMQRLGLGDVALAAVNPRLIYCSITGYGQHGRQAQRAGHDLNYVAESGLLGNSVGRDGAPVLPATQVADIGGGSWPAVINVLLALIARERDGRGCRLDVAMADNIWPFQLAPLAQLWAAGAPPAAGHESLSGGLPRYQLYETRDGRWLALGALEDRFFARFAEIAGLQPAAGSDGRLTRDVLARRIRELDAADWLQRCEGEDVCVSPVLDLAQAVRAATLDAVRAFAAFADPGRSGVPPLPLPLDPALRGRAAGAAAAHVETSGWPGD